MQIFTVSDTAELMVALDTATAGDRIELAGGHYGDLALFDLTFDGDVTIAAADPENPPEFSSVSLWKVSHLAFDAIAIDFQPDASTLEWSPAFSAEYSDNITIRNSTLVGGPAVVGTDPDSEPGTQGSQGIIGYPVGRGLTLIGSDDVTIEDCEISGFSRGVHVFDVDGLTMIDNDIHGFRRVGLGGSDVSNVLIEGNTMSDPTPWKLGGQGDHGDFIHLWTDPKQTEPSENIVIRGNFLSQGTGEPIIGIYLDDNTGGLGFHNVAIDQNVIYTANGQGMRIEDATNLSLRQNSLLYGEGHPNDAPSIFLADGVRNAVVDGNIYGGLTGPALEDSSGHSISVLSNLVVQLENALAPNFIGSLFANALGSDPDPSDLRPVTGGMADGLGPQWLPDSEPMILSTPGRGRNLDSHVFALDLPVDLAEGVQVIWDFGDGTTATGRMVRHSFDNAGRYDVSAVVIGPKGETWTVDRTVEVLSPVALQETFDLDAQSAHASVANTGYNYVEDRFGTALRIHDPDASVSFETTPEMMTNKAFTLSFAFRKEPGEELSGGRALQLSGTATIDIGTDGMTLRGRTDLGESFTLSASDLGIADTEWHQVTYSFSQQRGTATLYVDGVAVAQANGLKGAQYAIPGQELHLGGAYGNSFVGLLDNFSFLHAALTDTAVARSYSAFTKGRLIDYEGRGGTEVLVPNDVDASLSASSAMRRLPANERASDSPDIVHAAQDFDVGMAAGPSGSLWSSQYMFDQALA
jgi:hypothetical protein